MDHGHLHAWGPTRAGWCAVGLLLVAPVVLFAMLRIVPATDITFGSGSTHFYVVSMVAALALVLAVCVIWAARRLPDARTFFLAMGFVSMATIFLAHGLGTSPWFSSHHDSQGEAYAAHDAEHEGHGGEDEYLEEEDEDEYASGAYATYGATPDATAVARSRVVGYSAQLSLLVSAFFFALATVSLGDKSSRFVLRHRNALLVVCTALLAGHVLAALFYPGILSPLPMNEPWMRYPTALAAIACMSLAAVRFFQSYRLALLPLQGAMALGMALLIEAQVFMTWGVLGQLSWWEYHFVMLAGFLVPVASLLAQYRVAGDLGAIVEGLFLRHQVNGIRAGDPRAMVVLGAAVAAKDSETSDHIERVGELSVQIGRYLGLSDDRLDVLRWAGRLHDVGKIGVPNSILRKPGTLTEHEFEIMKLHSPRGGNIAIRSETLEAAATIIRSHHERMDGAGYPDGLAADQIPFEARIVSVADVWDALTCNRPYRKAMARDEAAAVVRRESGPHLDPKCVDALFAVLEIDGIAA